MTSLANNGNNFRLLTPQSELEEKNYLSCPNKILKNFSANGASDTGVEL
jgi:hypothetical protein